MKIAVTNNSDDEASKIISQIESLGYDIDVETQISIPMETNTEDSQIENKTTVEVVDNKSENNETENSIEISQEEKIQNETSTHGQLNKNEKPNENQEKQDGKVIISAENSTKNQEVVLDEVDLNGHYLSIGSGSSYGYFGVNWQIRKGVYAFSTGLGVTRLAIGNKLYLSNKKNKLRNLYCLVNLGYDLSLFEDYYYDEFTEMYISEYALKGIFASFLAGFNHQWQKENVALGLNIGIGIEAYSLEYSPTSVITYDLGFVIKF